MFAISYDIMEIWQQFHDTLVQNANYTCASKYL